jgi:pSer/pThr/pTyr-binding forkhead associated (FHA) protein
LPRFVVEKGRQAGREFLLEDRARLGRDPGCAIAIEDENVSREHAEVRLARGRVQIVDLQSRNGTMVNGAKVKQAALADGDRVRVGDTTLRFAADEAPAGGAERARRPAVAAAREPRRDPTFEAVLFAAVIVLVFLVASYFTQVLMRLAS